MGRVREDLLVVGNAHPEPCPTSCSILKSLASRCAKSASCCDPSPYVCIASSVHEAMMYSSDTLS